MRILIKGGVWKNSEDEILKAAVMKYGLNNWSRVASLLIRKSAKQCKARWYEWLDPSVKKTEWTKEEEEKLLHLAKLFPTQWKTIAPRVGRTAHQCLEHYEKLIDQAQGKDESNTSNTLASARRLKPGEIDPNPETKPSRADPVDLDDDEKEMLAEARARLANTRGKKAKRKAREKQLEAARRLASLQKRRELKAAGLTGGGVRKIRRKFIDYAKEIPFEVKPKAGFYEVGVDETPQGSINFANISLQQLEGKRRDDEIEKLRKEDQRKLKRLQSDDLPKAMEIVEQINNPQIYGKRTKLTLPEPQLTEDELNEIVKIGSEQAALTSSMEEGPTSALLSNYTHTPQIQNVRTPRQNNTVELEVQNAIARTQTETPLEGGVNPQLNEVGNSSSATPSFTPIRTPNPLATTYGNLTPSLARKYGAQTPSSVAGSATPFRDDVSINESVTDDGRSIHLTQLHIKQALNQLPAPQNEIEVELNQLPDDNEQVDEPLEEDMEDILKKKAEEKRIEEIKEWKRQTQVIQQSLPRPYILSSIQLSNEYNSSNYSNTLFVQSEDLLNNELKQLIVNDAFNFPITGVKLPNERPQLDKFEDEELKRARNLLTDEIDTIKESTHFEKMADFDQLEKTWEKVSQSMIYTPSQKSITSFHTLTKLEKIEALKRQFEDISKQLANNARRTQKLEKQYTVLTHGYEIKINSLTKTMDELYTELNDTHVEFNALNHLKAREAISGRKRVQELHGLVESGKKLHTQLQKRYGYLSNVKDELNTLLMNATKR